MKVIIDTDKKTIKIIGLTTIPELVNFTEQHGLGDYILLASDENQDYDRIQPNTRPAF